MRRLFIDDPDDGNDDIYRWDEPDVPRLGSLLLTSKQLSKDNYRNLKNEEIVEESNDSKTVSATMNSEQKGHKQKAKANHCKEATPKEQSPLERLLTSSARSLKEGSATLGGSQAPHGIGHSPARSSHLEEGQLAATGGLQQSLKHVLLDGSAEASASATVSPASLLGGSKAPPESFEMLGVTQSRIFESTDCAIKERASPQALDSDEQLAVKDSAPGEDLPDDGIVLLDDSFACRPRTGEDSGIQADGIEVPRDGPELE